MKWSKESLAEVAQKISQMAAADREFRELCLRDIHAAFEKVSGQKIPSELKINVVDNTGYHYCIVLPDSNGNNDELNENELKKVSGGVGQQEFEIEKYRI